MKKVISILVVVILVISLSLNVLCCTGYGEVDLTCIINKIKVVVNGTDINKGHNAEVETILYKGTTYIPLRKVSENLGCSVIYEPNTSTVYIDTEQEELYGW